MNTIHAGTEAEGVAGQWAAAARLGDGNYLAIDQDRAVAQVAAPQDEALGRLSAALNGTYLAYGAQGKVAAARQAAQDANAAATGASTLSTRAMAKAAPLYTNGSWDLVDARQEGKRPAAMAVEDLPEALRNLAPAERDAYVERKAAERKALQTQIGQLTVEREAFVRTEQARRASEGGKTLDDALLESARAQATARAYEF